MESVRHKQGRALFYIHEVHRYFISMKRIAILVTLLAFALHMVADEQLVPDSLCTVDTLHWDPNPAMQARHAARLADKNSVQLTAATRFGIKAPLPTRGKADAVTAGLTKIESCDAYTVDSLEYSIPWLTSAAASLVADIGTAFRDSVAHAGLGDYLIIVTSVLRTVEDVSNLRASGNRNAVTNSTHCYATTFDISYERFFRCATPAEWEQAGFEPHAVGHIHYADAERLTDILVSIVARQRARGRCYAIFERGENCIHITVRQSSH